MLVGGPAGEHKTLVAIAALRIAAFVNLKPNAGMA
jgi:hypothetical protein